jgi:hypothetical protein
MALTPVPTIDPALPVPPNPADEEAVFDAKAYAWSEALPEFGSDVKSIGDATYANAQWAETKAGEAAASAIAAAGRALAASDSASDSATSASASAGSATEAALLTEKYQGALATDPTLDKAGSALTDGDWYVNSVTGFIRAYTTAGGWVNGITAVAGVNAINGQTGGLNVKTLHGVTTLGTGDLITYTTTAVSKTLANMEHCTVTAATQTITLPASPSEGFECYISVGAFDYTVLARNGQTIMGVAEDMQIDKNLVTVTARFTIGTWRIV